MTRESKMIDKLIEIDKEMKAEQEQISGYVYIVFSEWKHQGRTNYDNWSLQYEKEIEFILDNEDKAKEMVQDFNNSYGKDGRVNYYYEKWEIMHYE